MPLASAPAGSTIGPSIYTSSGMFCPETKSFGAGVPVVLVIGIIKLLSTSASTTALEGE